MSIKSPSSLSYIFIMVSMMCFSQGELHIDSQASLYLTNNSSLTLNNAKLINNGALTDSNGTIFFTGNAATSNATLGGSGTTQINHLTINKSSNDVQLNTNITLAGNLTLSSGGLDLANGNVVLNTTGQVQNESATNYIYGTGGRLIAQKNLNAPTNENPGNLGASISSSENLGLTTITRSHNEETIGSSSSILRNFTISPTNNTNLDATLTFAYLEDELNNNTESDLFIWQSFDSGTTWTSTNGSINTTSNTAVLSAINAFGKYTLFTDETAGVKTPKDVNTFVLFNNNGNITAQSSLKIKGIALYDATGKLILNKAQINATQAEINLQLDIQLLLVTIEFENGQRITKKIIFKP